MNLKWGAKWCSNLVTFALSHDLSQQKIWIRQVGMRIWSMRTGLVMDMAKNR